MSIVIRIFIGRRQAVFIANLVIRLMMVAALVLSVLPPG
jgi:hypothetical protein